MKRFIVPFALATLAVPFVATAQSTPSKDDEKPPVPPVPVPATETVVPAVPAVPLGGVATDKTPAAVPSVPGLTEKPAAREQKRSGAPGARRPGAPDAKRRGPPEAKNENGAPAESAPASPGAAPEAKPSTEPQRPAPAPGRFRPSGRPAETRGTPPASRGKKPETPGTADTPPATPGTTATPPATPGTADTPPARRGNGPGARGKKPETPGTTGTLPTTPGTTDTPPATPGTPVMPTEKPSPAATPGATGADGNRRPPGKRPADPQQRGDAPSPAPAPTPGTPAPSATSSRPQVSGEPKAAQRSGDHNRPDRPEDRDRPERPAAQKPPSQETAKVLEDEPKRDRQADAAQARRIDSPADAKRLLLNILGGGAGGADSHDRPDRHDRAERPDDRGRPDDRHGPDDRRRPDHFHQGYRPSAEEVGRTQQDRERTVSSIVERFQGHTPPPQAAPSGRGYREQRIFDTVETQRRTQFYDGNRRVIRYSSMQEIPPVIVASQQLNRVELLPQAQAQSRYSIRPPAPQQQQQARYVNEIPPSYSSGDAYAVSYSVDPESAISTDAILFRQGSTDFADAYSYDLVVDMADAMKSPSLANDTFVIEGHASAEGDYASNLQLSQERAERISRELVRHGVSAERLMPVGYGEAEASYPADAPEADRRLDRRVVVFRMK